MGDLNERIAALTPHQREALLAKLAAKAQSAGPAAIQRRPAAPHARLSFAQHRLWLLHQFGASSGAYNIPIGLRIRGPLDLPSLTRAFADLGRRHEILRTRFVVVDGEPRSIVDEDAIIDVRTAVLRDGDDATREEDARRIAADAALAAFDLTIAPLARSTLVRFADDDAVLIIVVHHIVCDGWSLDILIRELMAYYAAARGGTAAQLEPLPIQYADFAEWQRGELEGQRVQSQLQYWRERLTGAPVLDLPSDHSRPAVLKYSGALESVTLSPALAAGLGEAARREKATLAMVMLGAFQTLLWRYGGQDDIVVGSAIANRNVREIEPLIGCFINTLALRTDLSGDPTFSELIGRVRDSALGAYDHQDVPFEKLVEELQPERNVGRNPLFQAIVSVNALPPANATFGDLTIGGFDVPMATSRFDLELHVFERGDAIRLDLCYSTELFHAATASRLLHQLQRLLGAMVTDPGRRLSEVSLLDDDERRRVLIEWNNTAREYPRDESIHVLFGQQVRRTPYATALVSGDRSFTYADLDKRANQLASHLRENGVAPRTLVAVCLDRGVDLIVSLLAVLKAGAAYVPLDPEYPQQRLSTMLEDARPPVLLTERRFLQSLSGFAGRAVCLDDDRTAVSERSADDVAVDIGAEDLAYVMYTSGSTGRPKGVEVLHRGVTRLVCGADYVRLGPGETLLQLAPVSFDASTFEIWGALLNGGRLALYPDRVATPAGLAQAIRRDNITTMWLTASLFNSLIDDAPESLQGIQQLLIGGEALSIAHVRRAYEKLSGVQIINGYGPTESTTFACCFPIPSRLPSGSRSIPIGRPISNTRAYVLDAACMPVPQGARGELYIGGDGLARGYLNRPDLTRERFLDVTSGVSERLYRTGDLARWLADGSIEFLGRNDDQVKIRGFRIEPGEIESTLSEHPAVASATVVVRTDSGEKRLIAYIVGTSERPAAGWDELRGFLRQRLPEYMVPSAFVALDRLPLGANGKIDRGALPAPGSGDRQTEQSLVAPRSELEQRIAEIWRAALGKSSLGVRDNFFDLGGHSLLLLNVHAQLVAALRTDVSIVELFQFPTIESLANHLGGKRGQNTASPKQARRPARSSSRAIAVVGMAARFPGASDVAAFWDNLRSGVESIRVFTEEELAAAGVPETALRDPRYVKARAVLDDVDRFDARFFGYTPREAELMDPQHRLFLECSTHALESAACDPSRFDGRIGVYAGARINSYALNLLFNPERIASAGALQTLVSTASDFLPTRVSYKLNLRGPSVNVQTACSTSLVAVHHACQSLINDECDVALAGGVAVSVPGVIGYVYQEDGIGSPDGHCRTFDAKARGTVGGDGVGVVVLKRLDDALASGDAIRAVIRGTAINNDGSLKIGFTAPSVEGQAEVVRLAHVAAGIDAAAISYVEAHGTATSLGDPIEIAALNKAFGVANAGATCAIGSVKSNVGHLDAAAGVAGLVKTVLMLEHREIAPSLHFEQANPQIAFDSGPFAVNAQLRSWDAQPEAPRCAGVSSFGIGGTNAHVVLEEAPDAPASSPSVRAAHLLMLSARTADALTRTSSQLASHLERHPALNLADIAYTLQVGRQGFDQRRVVRCRTSAEAADTLGGRSSGRSFEGTALSGRVTVAFLFPGQGSQYPGMGRDLYEQEPAFRDAFDACCGLMEPPLAAAVRLAVTSVDRGAESALAKTSVTQAALFAVEWALARLWMRNGIAPSACIGHSVGEYVAACVAGVLTLEDAVRLLAVRGRLMDEAPAGAMLAATVSEAGARQRLTDGVWLAAVNSPTQCVFSGSTKAIAALEETLRRDRIDCRRLQTAGAFHSELMSAVLQPLTDAARSVTVCAPQVPYVSNLTGTWLTEGDLADATYWARHVRECVRFSDGMRHLCESGINAFIEVGPGRTLTSFVKPHADATSRTVVALPSMVVADDGVSDSERIVETLGRLWIAGAEPDWTQYYADERRLRVELPGYPFARERYWIDGPAPESAARPDTSPTKQSDPSRWLYQPTWAQAVTVEDDGSAADDARRWLVFADASGIADQALASVARSSDQVVRVTAGDRFDRSAGGYIVNPASAADHRALIDALRADGAVPARVVHAWSIDPSDGSLTADARAMRTFNSLTHLVHAAASARATDALDLRVLSDRAFAVTGDEALQPAQALLLGLCRVIPQEQPNIRCSMVDLDGGGHAAAVAQLGSILAAPPQAPVLALRGTRAWKRTFEVRRTGRPVSVKSRLKDEGVYLVTGGLGRIGLALAEHLVQSVRARVVLVGRSSPTSAAMRRVQQMENAGGRVLTVQTDVANAAEMAAAVSRAEQTFGPISGVFHLAGTTSADCFCPTAELDERVRDAQFRPKVEGTRVLAQVLEGKPLDFVLLSSSISTVLGGLGFAAYASANAFMESFAEAQVRTNTVPWVSIAWDGWAFGSAAGETVPTDASTGQFALSPAEGIEAFDLVLGLKGNNSLVVSTCDLHARIERLSGTVSALEGESIDRADGLGQSHPRPALGSRYVAPRDSTERAIVAVWEELLGIQPIGVDDNFFELGGHSLLAVQLVFRLTTDLGVELSAHPLFEAPTVAGLAAAVAQARREQQAESERIARVLDQVSELSDEEVERMLAKEEAS